VLRFGGLPLLVRIIELPVRNFGMEKGHRDHDVSDTDHVSVLR